MLFKGNRCKFHGGKSLSKADKEKITAETGRIFQKPGPKTPEGLARVTSNLALTPSWQK